MKYDLIVIGAGPAGCITASTSASKGLRVLVLEKRELGWEKPCGGAISPRGVAEFKIPQKAIDRYCRSVYLCSPSEKDVKVELKGAPGALCMRASLDSWLVDRARESGAELKARTTATTPIIEGDVVAGVRAKADSGATTDYRANLVVAADGTPSNFARKMGVFEAKNLVAQASCVQYQMTLPNAEIDSRIGDCIELYFGSKWCPRGYSWIFPKKGIVSVGNIAWMHVIAGQKFNLKELLDRFIKKHPIASKKLVGARVLYPQSHMIGFWGIAKKHVGDGYIVTGDAGGFASYVTAEGIYYSMKAGQYAAETVLEATEKGDFTEKGLKTFNERVNGSPIASDMTKGLTLRKTFLDDDAKQEMFITSASKDPKLAGMVGKLIGGIIPYKALVP